MATKSDPNSKAGLDTNLAPEPQSNPVTMEQLVSLAKRKGFIFPASEIYGGLAGFYDYGPYGVELANNIKALWWQEMVRKKTEVYGVDGAIIQSPKLWKASGHVDGFIDPLVDCKNCKSRFRADHLAGVDTADIPELTNLLQNTKCPSCGKQDLTPPRTYNMMMKTYIGPIEDEDSVSYLRPETAGSIFTNFKLVQETTRSKIPFGIAQIGKAFRNEISPRDFIFRVRELEQMEIEYFVHPESAETHFNQWKEQCWNFLKLMGLDQSKLQWHQHTPDERAHYAADAYDIQYQYPFGFKELWGIANRTDYDLKHHSEGSGKDLTYFDEETKTRYTPYIIEPSVGLGRLLLAALDSAYEEQLVSEGDTRTVLHFSPLIAPVKAAILPLMKKPELTLKAKEIHQNLVQATGLNIEYDESGSIGKRYRRQDEIGTPICITIDFETLEDGCVTIRDRDTMAQIRLKISDIKI